MCTAPPSRALAPWRIWRGRAVSVRDAQAEGVVLREADEVSALVAGDPDGPDSFV
jgi:hypothetical protein